VLGRYIIAFSHLQLAMALSMGEGLETSSAAGIRRAVAKYQDGT